MKLTEALIRSLAPDDNSADPKELVGRKIRIVRAALTVAGLAKVPQSDGAFLDPLFAWAKAPSDVALKAVEEKQKALSFSIEAWDREAIASAANPAIAVADRKPRFSLEQKRLLRYAYLCVLAQTPLTAAGYAVATCDAVERELAQKQPADSFDGLLQRLTGALQAATGVDAFALAKK